MEPDEFAALVGELTEHARRDLASFRRRVAGFVVLGYLGVLGMLLLALALTLGAIALLVWLHAGWLLKLAWIPLGFGFVVFRSLWVRVAPPAGLPLPRTASPTLLEEIDDVCARVDAPPVHRVLVVPEYNAGVVQVPRLGLLGWHRSYLTLGLPLLQALSRDQLRAVVAHELGHLARSHGRFGNRVYAMRVTWIRIHEKLQEERRFGRVFVRAFLDWYAPRLDAHASVLRRAHEHEADQAAAAATSPGVMAATLARSEVVDRFLAEEFWPAVSARAATEPEPPVGVFAELGRALERPVAPEKAAAWLAAAAGQSTEAADSHPSYSARLRDLGVAPAGVEAAPPDGPAAATLLGEALPALVQACDDAWRAAARQAWRTRHHEVAAARARLAGLRERAELGAIRLDEHRELVQVALDLGERDTGRVEAERLLAAHPDDAPGQYLLGVLLLEEDDERGLGHLERAMELDQDAIESSCALAAAFLERRGRGEEAARHRARAEERHDLVSRAQLERQTLTPSDRFEPHGLAAEPLDYVVSALRLNPEIAGAFLVRKPVKLMPEVPHHALVVLPHLPGFRPDRSERCEALARWVDQNVPVPGSKVVSVLDDDRGAMRAALETVPGAKVYTRR